MKVSELRIEPKFRDLIPQLSKDEYAQLERNILEDGEIREHIIAWDGVIIDGHNRYKIWMAHQSLDLPCTVDNWHFNNEYEAMSWACNNQLGRRNLSDEQKTYLLGKRYENEKLAHGAPAENKNAKLKSAKQKAQNEPFDSSKKRDCGTAQRLADEYGVGRETVKRAEKFSKGIDVIEKQEPELKDAILSGAVKIPKATIRELSEAEPEEQKAAVEAIKHAQKAENPKDKAKAIKNAKVALGKEEKPEVKPELSGDSLCRPSTDKEIIGNLYGGQDVSYTIENLCNELLLTSDRFVEDIELCLSSNEELVTQSESKSRIAIILEKHIEKVLEIKRRISNERV